MASAQKIETLKEKARKLWPKYDPDLNSMVDGRKKIHAYIANVFSEAKLTADLEKSKQTHNIDELIDD